MHGLPEALSDDEVSRIEREHRAGDARYVRFFQNKAEEPAYVEWIRANPNGFVLTISTQSYGSRIHHAHCGMVQRRPTVSHRRRKAVAPRAGDLQVWARLEGRHSVMVDSCRVCGAVHAEALEQHEAGPPG